MSVEGFQAFEAKWFAAEPGFALIRLFLPAARRPALTAFGCLVFEIEQAALQVSDAAIGNAKLGWWAEEIHLAMQGHARHPITAALFADSSARDLPAALWTGAVAGAALLRSTVSASDLAAMRQVIAPFYAPLVAIETALMGRPTGDPALALDVWCNGLLMREALRYPQVAASGRTSIPLDLMARHQVSRTDLAVATTAAGLALRDFLLELDRCLETALVDATAVAMPRRAQARLDRLRIAKILGCRDHALALASGSRPNPLRQLLAIWREARRRD